MVKLTGLLSGVWLAGGGCLAAGNYIEGRDCSELMPFFRKPIHDQFTEFARLDTEGKYVIYLCGNQFVHPPAQYLVEPFARDGPSVVAFLSDKLSQASDDLTIRDIVRVLKEMRRQKTYDVASDKTLTTLVTDRVDRMRDDDWRRITRQMLKDISE